MTMDQKPVSVNGAITTVSGQYEKKEYREESDVFPGVLLARTATVALV